MVEHRLARESRALRVMFVHRWGAIMAGGEIWMKSLAEYLSAQEVDIVAALHIQGPLHAALTEMGIATHTVTLSFLRAAPRPVLIPSALGMIRSAFELATLIRRTNVQIVHAFSLEAAEAAFFASRLARVPFVVTIQNCGPYPKFDHSILGRSDRVIAISGAVETDLLRLRVLPERVIRIPPGIPFDRLPEPRSGELRRELGVSENTPLIGMLATLERKKAQDNLLRAVPIVLETFPTARFVLIGGDHATTAAAVGAYETELRLLARSLGIVQHVQFLGFRPNATTLLGDLDVSVLCSRREALGLAAVESLAIGVPLVATAVEGLREVVDDGTTGMLVPPDDPRALADGIRILLSNRALARSLSSAGRNAVRERFDARLLALRHHALYESLLSDGEQAVRSRHLRSSARR